MTEVQTWAALGMLCATLIGTLGFASTWGVRFLNARFDAVNYRFEAMDAKFETRFIAMDAKFEARFEAMDAKFTAVDTKIDGLHTVITNLDRDVQMLVKREMDR